MESELISDLPMDVSFWGLVLQADTIVKIVMLILLIASIWSWSIIIEKTKRFFLLKKQANAFEETFWSGESLEKLYKEEEKSPQHPLATVFVAGMYEWTRASNSNSLSNEKIQAGLQERIHQVMNVAVTRELENVEKNIGFLATVGSTAPFIGLFGTVWGIMNSFQSIALSKDTSLAVVAPGIAEALLATALGLVAAIPAVIAYNKLSNNLNTYALRLQNFASEFEALLSRHLSEQSSEE
ncbi:MAG: protein TolQ [Pelagibacterales bacterium]|jgi:biopolymer transport protein TolQ|nr:protein TolQ [Pelagibacterales bacterium]MDB3956002.1 protein TolQ [Alphaproteobacteria bacterium]|tara:strand:+ start:1491 stop:2210 length:720 start_codon:yes stop_codon:yes gene_type:complete